MVWNKALFRWLLGMSALLILLTGVLLVGPQQQPRVEAASCWKAEITEQRTDVDLAGSVLRVSVQGRPGLWVVVRSMGSFQTINVTGTKPEYGPYVAEFAPLSKGTYYIEPVGLGISYKIWLDGKNYTRVEFRPLLCPPTPTPTPRPPNTITPLPRPTATRQPAVTPVPPSQPPSAWQGRVVKRLDSLAGRHFATIAVRVVGRPAGQEVEIQSTGWSATCKTGTKPEHGPDACEFGALNAGTYRLSPKDLGTYLDVPVGLQDFVLVEFRYTGPPPGTRWVGSVVENTSGSEPTEHVNSAIAVVVAGRPWHEVEIRSDNWSTTSQTGHKPEYGPDAAEFGGLRAGTYTITPKDLGVSVAVTVDGWGWAMVRFDEVALPAPKPAAAVVTSVPPQPAATTAPGPTAMPQQSPAAAGSRWQGWVLSNTSGQQEGTGVWSVIIVRVLNYPGVPVRITGGGGWTATCTTGTKPEYGPDACEFGGLWPGTYYLQPEGADIQLEIEMDGLGMAEVHFTAP